jgi:hypothetical protein
VFRRKQANAELADEWLRIAREWMTSGDAVSSVAARVSIIYALGAGGSLDRAQPLLEVVKVGHALRATVGTFEPAPPLPVAGLDVTEIKRLAVLPFNKIGSHPVEEKTIDEVAAYVQPYVGPVDFWGLLPVDAKVWDRTVGTAASLMRRNGYRISGRAGSSMFKVGYVLRALEEALELPPGS